MENVDKATAARGALKIAFLLYQEWQNQEGDEETFADWAREEIKELLEEASVKLVKP